MGRKYEMMNAWINARNHDQMPNIVWRHPDNPTLRYHMREHTEEHPDMKLGQLPQPAQRLITGVDTAHGGASTAIGGAQFQAVGKEFKAKKPPKAVREGAFPEPGMASLDKPCKTYEPAISIGHEHACGNCGWNHK